MNTTAFQWDAYRPHADHACFSSHQMSALGEAEVNRFEEVSSHGHQMSLAGQAGGCQRSLYSEV